MRIACARVRDRCIAPPRVRFTPNAPPQLIAEGAHFCRAVARMAAPDVGALLGRYNKGPNASYLLEATSAIYAKRDEDGGYLIDALADASSSKGTGMWTIQEAAQLGVPCGAMAAALEARYLSASAPLRASLAALHASPAGADAGAGEPLPTGWEGMLEDALYCSKVVAYAQGTTAPAAPSPVSPAELSPRHVSPTRPQGSRSSPPRQPSGGGTSTSPASRASGAAGASSAQRCSTRRAPRTSASHRRRICSPTPRSPPRSRGACPRGAASCSSPRATACRSRHSPRRSPTTTRSRRAYFTRRSASRRSATASACMASGGATPTARSSPSGAERANRHQHHAAWHRASDQRATSRARRLLVRRRGYVGARASAAWARAAALERRADCTLQPGRGGRYCSRGQAGRGPSKYASGRPPGTRPAISI